MKVRDVMLKPATTLAEIRSVFRPYALDTRELSQF